MYCICKVPTSNNIGSTFLNYIYSGQWETYKLQPTICMYSKLYVLYYSSIYDNNLMSKNQRRANNVNILSRFNLNFTNLSKMHVGIL